MVNLIQLKATVDYIIKFWNQVGKLYLYHGEEDGWSPLKFRDNLLKEVPELKPNARIDSNDIPHAFVEFDGEQVGEIIGDWMKEIEKKEDMLH